MEIWLEEEHTTKLKQVLLGTQQAKFLEIKDEVINTADIVGIFKPATMHEEQRNKAGHGTYRCDGCNRKIPVGKICGYCSI